MEITEKNIVARFPNGLLQVRIPKDDSTWSLDFMIVDSQFKPIIDEIFSGVVYLNENKFEVYRQDDNKQGVLEVGQGIDWESKTPNELRNEANQVFRTALDKNLDKIAPHCMCSYPRMIDYITKRPSIDAAFLQQIFMNQFLILNRTFFDQKMDEYLHFYECKICQSQFKHRHKERGIDIIEVINLEVEEIGAAISDQAPNYLTALFNELFYRESYLHRSHLYPASLSEMINYLFQKKSHEYTPKIKSKL